MMTPEEAIAAVKLIRKQTAAFRDVTIAVFRQRWEGDWMNTSKGKPRRIEYVADEYARIYANDRLNGEPCFHAHVICAQAVGIQWLTEEQQQQIDAAYALIFG